MSQFGKLFRFIVAYWNKLLVFAAFIIGTIGSFWVDPPYTPGSDNAEALAHFAKFIIAGIIGLMAPLMLNWFNKKKYAIGWLIVAGVSLYLSITVYFEYHKLFVEWTRYHIVENNDKDEKKVLVIGSREDLREDVKDFVRENPSMSDKELLQNAAWKPSNVWKEDAIRRRRHTLSMKYVLFTPIFAIFMIAVAQAMICIMSKE